MVYCGGEEAGCSVCLDHEAASLVYTSIEDCRSSMPFHQSVVVLKHALELSQRLGHKTRSKVIQSRIRQLEKPA